jgi:hypothetical protein
MATSTHASSRATRPAVSSLVRNMSSEVSPTQSQRRLHGLSGCSIPSARSAAVHPRVRRSSGKRVRHGLAKVELQPWQRGDCVETASGAGVVLVRDTTNRDGGTLALSADAWIVFTSKIKSVL